MYDSIQTHLRKLKRERPLVLNVTNYVTMQWVANGLLSLGASPIMTQAIEEIEDLVAIAAVVVINIGTLDPAVSALCERAIQLANQHRKPVVLDPVGVGASLYRTQTCQDWLRRFNIAMIRGNASEIIALAGIPHQTKGVDSQATTASAIASAKQLAQDTQAVITVSGRTDAIIHANQAALFERGSPLMPQITGSGCLFSAVIGAFMTIEPDHYAAAASATVFYSVCGELAARKSQGPGTFAIHFIDALSLQPERYDYE